MWKKKMFPLMFNFFVLYGLWGRSNVSLLSKLFTVKTKTKFLDIDAPITDFKRVHNLLIYNSVISQKFFDNDSNFALKNYKRMVKNCLLVFRGAIYLNKKFIIVDSGEQEYIFKLYYLLYGYSAITKYSNFFFLSTAFFF